MVDQHHSKLPLDSNHPIFRVEGNAAGSLVNRWYLQGVIEEFDDAIRDCVNFQLPESPSAADVLWRHHREYCVMRAWVGSIILLPPQCSNLFWPIDGNRRKGSSL
jgi:hypothetical protein